MYVSVLCITGSTLRDFLTMSLNVYYILLVWGFQCFHYLSTLLSTIEWVWIILFMNSFPRDSVSSFHEIEKTSFHEIEQHHYVRKQLLGKVNLFSAYVNRSYHRHKGKVNLLSPSPWLLFLSYIASMICSLSDAQGLATSGKASYESFTYPSTTTCILTWQVPLTHGELLHSSCSLWQLSP